MASHINIKRAGLQPLQRHRAGIAALAAPLTQQLARAKQQLRDERWR